MCRSSQTLNPQVMEARVCVFLPKSLAWTGRNRRLQGTMCIAALMILPPDSMQDCIPGSACKVRSHLGFENNHVGGELPHLDVGVVVAHIGGPRVHHHALQLVHVLQAMRARLGRCRAGAPASPGAASALLALAAASAEAASRSARPSTVYFHMSSSRGNSNLFAAALAQTAQ